MSALATTTALFTDQLGLSDAAASRLLGEALQGADDGELFLEYRQSEALALVDGQLKTASLDAAQGFGLRAVAEQRVGYAQADDFSEAALSRAAQAVRAVQRGYEGSLAVAPQATNRQLYGPENPVNAAPFTDKVAMLAALDTRLRQADSRVSQVSLSLLSSWQAVEIRRADGTRKADIRPLLRFNVSVIMQQGERRESGSFGFGGRASYADILTESALDEALAEALRQAEVNLEAQPAPAGEMTVVLGAGWPGVLIHEAVGHGLEGDFNRRGSSAYAGQLGEAVASPLVTVVDDGTLANRRGSVSIDDEGTPSAYNTLIEGGKLVGYMQDRQNARLMGVEPTGNGRRESYRYAPMPRMTNTYMLPGESEPEEIIASVDDGIYAASFGGGQVDIVSGQFTFQCTEAYRIRNGQRAEPLKGATLIGNGPEIMQRVSMVGNDMALDRGIGTCGKDGQGVPVGIGQPTLKIDRITVGGTA